MAEGIANWSPYATHVQGGLKDGQFINGQFVLLCAGPPYYSQVGFPGDASGDSDLSETLLHPIGLAQNIAHSQNKAVSRIFEIGSNRSYFITGRTVGQVSFGRIMYHGPSLLRTLYAYYDTRGDETVGAFPIDPIYESGGVGVNPYSTKVDGGQVSPNLKSIHVPPGFGNNFMNLASDLFDQPMGLMLLLMDNALNNYSACYLENCRVPQHSMAVDSQGLIVQESVGIHYERLQPIELAQLDLIDTHRAPDESGGYAGA